MEDNEKWYDVRSKVKQDLINGVTKLLYVAPESLAKKETIDFFKAILELVVLYL